MNFSFNACHLMSVRVFMNTRTYIVISILLYSSVIICLICTNISKKDLYKNNYIY